MELSSVQQELRTFRDLQRTTITPKQPRERRYQEEQTGQFHRPFSYVEGAILTSWYDDGTSLHFPANAGWYAFVWGVNQSGKSLMTPLLGPLESREASEKLARTCYRENLAYAKGGPLVKSSDVHPGESGAFSGSGTAL